MHGVANAYDYAYYLVKVNNTDACLKRCLRSASYRTHALKLKESVFFPGISSWVCAALIVLSITQKRKPTEHVDPFVALPKRRASKVNKLDVSEKPTPCDGDKQN